MTTVESRGREPRRAPPEGTRVQLSAVVWISPRSALVARLDEQGHVTTSRIERGREPELSYLAIVAHAIGDQERVVILGPNATRLALEREYVAVYHRPERLIDVERSGRIEEAALVDRLYEVSTRGSGTIPGPTRGS
jgi:hypothetical protein